MYVGLSTGLHDCCNRALREKELLVITSIEYMPDLNETKT